MSIGIRTAKPLTQTNRKPSCFITAFENVEDQGKLRPWDSSEDMMKIKELGRIYEWLARNAKEVQS